MHLIESYATHCGLKIDKPYILEKFYPIEADKYITFHPFSKPSKNYDYWQTVLDLLLPILEKEEISIFQLGADEEEPFGGCMNLCGGTSVNQIAYVIKNSELHLGCDSFPTHLSAFYNKKTVAVYPNSFLRNVSPYWGSLENQTLIHPATAKPSFQLQEDPKSINLIKPEQIVKEVCGHLNLELDFPYETIYMGEAFHQKTVENIPNQVVDPKDLGVDTIYTRMDLDFNEGMLDAQLQMYPCSIVTDRPISAPLINKYKSRIHEMVYIITDNDDPKFAKFLESQRISYSLMTRLPKEEASKKKINYMDLENAAILKIKEYPEEVENLKKDIDNLYYISARLLLSRGKSYYNEADISDLPEEDQPVEHVSQIAKAKDSPRFWENLHKSLVLKRVD